MHPAQTRATDRSTLPATAARLTGFAASALLAAALGAAAWMPAPAWAQSGSTWIWVDSQGRQVFSDVPPPSSVPDRDIRKRPAAGAPALNGTAPGPTGAAQPGAAGAGNAPKVIDAEKADAEAAAQAEAKAQAEREAIEKRNAQIRADNCAQARRQLAALNAGTRLTQLNDKGENVVMDDAMRAQATERQRAVIRDNCGPAPAAAR